MMISPTFPKRRIFWLFVLISIISQIHSSVRAQNSDNGTYGASFLQIPVGPRLIASTDVVASMDPDASLMFSNPAALSGIRSTQMFITTANWLENMQLSAAGLVLPIARTDLQLGFSTRLLYSGGLKGYDDALNPVSEESFYDLEFSTALSRHFENLGLSLGLGLTYLREHLPPEDGNGYAFSFGATYRQRENSFHFFIKDFGGKMSFDGYDYPIDSRFVFGYGRSLALHQGQLNLGAQMVFSRADSRQFQIGGEYRFNRYFIIRSALNQYWESPTNSSFPLSGGLGFRFWNATIDYAYAPHSYFPATHMFSFTYLFGQLRTTQEPEVYLPPTTAPEFPSSPAAKKEIKERVEEQAGKKLETQEPKKVSEPKPESVPQQQPNLPAPDLKKNPPVKKPVYLLVAGIHGRMESAKAEAHTLSLLKIPATLEAVGSRYRVVIGKYDSLEKAQKAAKSYEDKGYRFEIVEE